MVWISNFDDRTRTGMVRKLADQWNFHFLTFRPMGMMDPGNWYN